MQNNKKKKNIIFLPNGGDSIPDCEGKWFNYLSLYCKTIRLEKNPTDLKSCSKKYFKS